jgi:hypothetical protein
MRIQIASPGIKRRLIMKVLKHFLVLLMILGTAGWAFSGVIPEMEECMRSHTTPQEYEAVITTPQEYEAVIKKYAEPGIIRQAMGLLVIKEPYVVKTEKEGSVTTYTVEGITVGTSSEIPADVVQMYRVSWEGGKIISLELMGPKKVD